MSKQPEQFSHIVYLICLFFLLIDIGVDIVAAVSPLQTWETSSTTLTGITGNAYSTYNEDSNFPECIFVFGGNVCTDCDTLFCYNITSDSLEDFGGIGTSLSTSERRAIDQQNAFIISDGSDDLLYYATGTGDVYYHDINDRDSADVLKTSFDVTYPNMVKHPDDIEFYILGYNSDEFYIYDLVENEHYDGNSLNKARVRGGVIVNEYYDDPYIYVMGGYSNYMERININDARNNEWELLQLLIQSSIDDQFSSVTVTSWRNHAIVTYANYIYLIGGYDASASSAQDDIIALDVANWEISWAGVFPTITSAMPATLAKDRVYTFGGWVGSGGDAGCFDDIYISNSFDDICESSSDCTINDDDDRDDEDDLLSVSPLQTWELSDASLTGITGNAYSAYNGDSSYPECIFVFGGNVCTDCDTLFCYNITSDSLEDFGSIGTSLTTSQRRAIAQQNAFILSDDSGDLLYYATSVGDVYYHDINDRDSTDVLKTSFDVTYPNMVKHPDDIEFYVIPYNSDEFYIYDLVENEHYDGNSLNKARVRAGVVVNEYYDDPYIYVLGGYSSYVERINIKDHDARDNKWELLQLLIQSSIDDQFSSVTVTSWRNHAIVSYANYIYLIGGYDASASSAQDDIVMLDVANWEISWAGVFPTLTSAMPATLAGDRVYTFGGWVGSGGDAGCFDDIYISNSFDEIGEGYSCSCDTSPCSETTQYPYTMVNENRILKQENSELKQENFALKQEKENNTNNNYYYNVLRIFELVLAMIGLYFCSKMVLSKCSNNNNNNKNWTIFNRYEYESIN